MPVSGSKEMAVPNRCHPLKFSYPAYSLRFVLKNKFLRICIKNVSGFPSNTLYIQEAVLRILTKQIILVISFQRSTPHLKVLIEFKIVKTIFLTFHCALLASLTLFFRLPTYGNIETLDVRILFDIVLF